ncbi:MAG: hypothetical protein J5714_02530 [Alphaproteobacteria bacterium]|nr:hypothetical protein [Alphaproteobacteria bacterium]
MQKFLKAFLTSIITMFVGVCYADTICSGTDFYDSELEACTPCPNGYTYNDTPGKTSVTECQIQCPAGTYVSEPGVYGYTRLEYLESTGSQYINTGFVHGSTNIRGEIRIGTNEAITSNVNILGNQTVSPKGGYSIGWAPSVFKLWVEKTGSRLSGPTHSLPANSIHDIVFELTANTRLLTYDGVTVTGSHTGGIVTTNPIHLFDNGIQQAGQNFSGRIYYIKLYEDGNLVHNFLPVQDSDNVIGIIDTVTGRFFTNSGTGNFSYNENFPSACVNVGLGHYAESHVVNFGDVSTTRTPCPVGTYSNIETGTSIASCNACVGATYTNTTGSASCKSCPTRFNSNLNSGKTSVTQCQISCPAGTYLGTYAEIPASYEQLEFIQSTGSQYIDTGINVSTLVNPVMSITMQYTTVEANKKSGAAVSSNGAQFTIGINATKAFSCDAGNNATIGAADTGKHTFVLDTQNGTCSMDDTTQNLTVGNLSAINKSIYVGGINGITGRVGKAKYYGFTLTSNNQVIMNLIPARQKSDSTIGMYDTINNTFYTNMGTGKFTAGNVVTRDICIDVGAGYYAPSPVFNYGDIGGRYKCAVGLTTPGYGHGADSEDDCGHVLHLDNQIIYARQDKITTPSINMEMPDSSRFYIPLSSENHNLSKLHIWHNGAEYTAYDDGLLYGERNPVTGGRISQAQ